MCMNVFIYVHIIHIHTYTCIRWFEGGQLRIVHLEAKASQGVLHHWIADTRDTDELTQEGRGKATAPCVGIWLSLTSATARHVTPHWVRKRQTICV